MKIKKFRMKYEYVYHDWLQQNAEEIIWGYQRLINIDSRYLADIKIEIIEGRFTPVKLSLKDI